MLRLFGLKVTGWKAWALRLFVIYPGIIYITLLLMISLMKESLVYPGVATYQHLTLDSSVFKNAVKEKQLTLWESVDGEYLGLKRTVENPEMRWIVFYGNGDVGLRATGWFEELARHLPNKRCDFYVMDYPGYGPQSGKTGEQAIVDLARKAAVAIPDDSVPLFFFGQSMGAGVCCRLVKEPEWNLRVEGLLLVNPYTSLIGASHQYLKRLVGPFHVLFPVEKIQQDRYESVENIKAFPGRVAIVAGEVDGLTPAWMAEKLKNQVPGESKLWIQKGVGHWTVPEPQEKWQELMDFVVGNKNGSSASL